MSRSWSSLLLNEISKYAYTCSNVFDCHNSWFLCTSLQYPGQSKTMTCDDAPFCKGGRILPIDCSNATADLGGAAIMTSEHSLQSIPSVIVETRATKGFSLDVSRRKEITSLFCSSLISLVKYWEFLSNLFSISFDMASTSALVLVVIWFVRRFKISR